MSRPILILAYVHAAYFIVTGAWPIVHNRSFEAVTGRKMDRWLVKTVGVLVIVVGGVIAMAACNRRLSPEIVVLAVGSAAALAAVDVVYVLQRLIPKVYLLDAVAEVGLILGWLLLWRAG